MWFRKVWNVFKNPGYGILYARLTKIMYSLRPYQETDVQNIRDEFMAGRKRVLYQLPTGGGKTVVFSYITERAASKGASILITVHRRELLHQASKHLNELGIRHGVIAAGFKPHYSQSVQLASIQTLARRLQVNLDPQLIINDEAHHSVSKSWTSVIENYPDAYLLGVTATPSRLDGKGLGKIFHSLVSGLSIRELISQGYLAKPRIFAPPSNLDLTGIRKRMGDYEKDALGEAVEKSSIFGDAIAHYRKHCDGATAICFCVSVRHAHLVADAFVAEGYTAKVLEGKMSFLERDATIENFAHGRIQVLTSCELVSEGFDLPAVGAAILLRPTKSLGLYLQQVGRALRPKKGTNEAIILDHVGNSIRHGHPESDFQWTLVDGVKKNSVPPIRVCKKCFCAYEPWRKECPKCGEVFPMSEKKPRELPEVLDGELEELAPEYLEFIKTAPLRTVTENVKDEAGLRLIAKARGYKPGWVRHIMESRQKREAERRG